MKKLFVVLTAIFWISLTSGKAQAFYVIDTGATPELGVLINGNYGVAMQFSLGQAYTITSIESMIYNWKKGTRCRLDCDLKPVIKETESPDTSHPTSSPRPADLSAGQRSGPRAVSFHGNPHSSIE